MQRLEAVLFDCDGTLLDTAPDIAQALGKMLEQEGYQPLPVEVVRGLTGEGLMELCRKALLASGAPETDDYYPFVQKFVALYRAMPAAPESVFSGAREALEALSAKGIKLAVCTNKPEAATRRIFEALGLLRHFAFIAGGDTFMVHKPHPAHVTGILEALEVKPENTLFVGDGLNDLRACQGAGVKCVLITHGAPRAEFDAMGADAVIEGFGEMKAAIEAVCLTIQARS